MTAIDTKPILLIDNHSLIREGLIAALAQLPVINAVIQADSLHLARSITAHRSDIWLVLLNLQRADLPRNLSLLNDCRALWPAAQTILIIEDQDSIHRQDYLSAGASDCISSTASAEAIHQRLITALQRDAFSPSNPRSTAVSPVNAAQSLPQLTPRQQQVLQLIGEGNSNKSISKQLGLSESTVRAHVTAILRRLQANNRAHAVQIGLRHQLIQLL